MIPATMSAPVAARSPRLELSLRNLLLLAAPGLAIVLRWGYRWSTPAVMLAVAPLLAFSFSLPTILRWQARRFERELLRRLQLRQTDRLRGLYRRQILLRLFATPSYLAGRRAMIAQELGEPGRARDEFRRALSGTDEAERLPLLIGLANACHQLGRDEEAEPAYREALRRGGRYPAVYHNLAQGLLRRAQKLDEALELAEEGLALSGSTGTDALLLLQAEIHSARGDRRRAKELAAQVHPTPETAARIAALG